MRYLTTILDASHTREGFTCGIHALDQYLHKQARQDMAGKMTVCFIHSDNKKDIKAFYTLSNGSIPRELLPAQLLKKLPKYKSLPVTLLGRLAVGSGYQGQNLGQMMLLDALKRSLDASDAIGSVAVVVDPINETAVRFYTKFHFINLMESHKMFLSMKTISRLFEVYDLPNTSPEFGSK
ncbi:MAG: GNAT family N-acetyltransferase [Bacteroidota bacterium]